MNKADYGVISALIIIIFLIQVALKVAREGTVETQPWLDTGWGGISLGYVQFQRERGLFEFANVHWLLTLWEPGYHVLCVLEAG